MSSDPWRCSEAVLSAILATVWLFVKILFYAFWGSWPLTFTFQGHETSWSRDHKPLSICFFRQFLGKTHRFATIHALQTTDDNRRVATDASNCTVSVCLCSISATGRSLNGVSPKWPRGAQCWVLACLHCLFTFVFIYKKLVKRRLNLCRLIVVISRLLWNH